MFALLKQAMAEAGHLVSEGEHLALEDVTKFKDYAYFHLGLSSAQAVAKLGIASLTGDMSTLIKQKVEGEVAALVTTVEDKVEDKVEDNTTLTESTLDKLEDKVEDFFTGNNEAPEATETAPKELTPEELAEQEAAKNQENTSDDLKQTEA